MASALTADICRHVSTSSAASRAERGAKWLDENFPGWEGRLDVATLDISSGENCICGQVFEATLDTLRSQYPRIETYSGFDYAHKTLFTEANSWISTLVGPALPTSEGQMIGQKAFTPEQQDRKAIVAQGLGFVCGTTSFMTVPGHFEDNVTYNQLTVAWKTLIQARIDTDTCTKAPFVAPQPVEVS